MIALVINDLIVLAKPGGIVEFLNVEFNVGTMYIQYTMYIRCTFNVHSMYIYILLHILSFLCTLQTLEKKRENRFITYEQKGDGWLHEFL